MGHVQVQVVLRNPSNPSLSKTTTALVDTGSTFTIIPRSLADELQLPRTGRSVRVLTASGVEVLEEALAHVVVPELDVWCLSPVLVSDKMSFVVIGVVTLEILGLRVDPVSGRLERTIALLL